LHSGTGVPSPATGPPSGSAAEMGSVIGPPQSCLRVRLDNPGIGRLRLIFGPLLLCLLQNLLGHRGADSGAWLLPCDWRTHKDLLSGERVGPFHALVVGHLFGQPVGLADGLGFGRGKLRFDFFA